MNLSVINLVLVSYQTSITGYTDRGGAKGTRLTSGMVKISILGFKDKTFCDSTLEQKQYFRIIQHKENGYATGFVQEGIFQFLD